MMNIPGNSPQFVLPPKRQKAALLLASGDSVATVASVLKCTARVIYDWLADATFQGAMREYQAEVYRRAQARLAEGQSIALDTLRAVMLDSETSASVKRAAAVDWLSLLLKYRDAGEIDERLRALEAAVNVQ